MWRDGSVEALAHDDGDARCYALAGGQFGAIARFQALAFLSARAIQGRVRSGRWQEVLPGTYVIEGAPRSREQEVMVALLWAMGREDTRAQSCASHTTAAWLHGLHGFKRPIHLITPRMLRPPSRAIVVHRMELEAVDVETVRGMRTTTPARTLLDLGAVVDIASLESALENALRRGLVSLPRLSWQLERCGGRGVRGAAALRHLLNDRNRGYIPSESELELRLFQLLRRRRLPLPVRQKVMKDDTGRFIARVDYAYPSHRLVIEVHGWKYHSGKPAWERDIDRGNRIVVQGERVLVFTWNSVTRRSEEVAATIKQALALTDPQGSLQLRPPKRSF